MKKSILISFAALAALSMASCVRENLYVAEGGNVRFVSNILPSASTKVSGDAWEDNDEVGIYMLKADEQMSASSPKTYTVNSQGAMSPKTESDTYMYPSDGANVSFYAYYPASQTAQNGLFALTNTTDFLFSNNASGLNNTNTSNVVLNFSHAMGKVVLKVSKADATESLEGLTVKLSGFYTSGSLNIMDGTWSAQQSTEVSLTQTSESTDDMKVFETMLIPSELSSLTSPKIVVTVGTKTKEVELTTGFDVQAGKVITQPMTLSTERMEVKLGTLEITAWASESKDAMVLTFPANSENSETSEPGAEPGTPEGPGEEETQPVHEEPAIPWKTIEYDGQNAIPVWKFNQSGGYAKVVGDASSTTIADFRTRICDPIKNANVELYVDLSGLVYNDRISANAFYMNNPNADFNTKIISVILPKNIIGIYARAFKNCSALRNVTITGESQVYNIAPDVFEGCTSLVSIIVPDSKYDAYIASPAWASVRDKIKKMSEETNKAFLPSSTN